MSRGSHYLSFNTPAEEVITVVIFGFSAYPGVVPITKLSCTSPRYRRKVRI